MNNNIDETNNYIKSNNSNRELLLQIESQIKILHDQIENLKNATENPSTESTDINSKKLEKTTLETLLISELQNSRKDFIEMMKIVTAKPDVVYTDINHPQSNYNNHSFPNHYDNPLYHNNYIGPQYPNHYIGPPYPNHYIGPQYPNNYIGPQYPNNYIGPQYPNHYIGPQYPNNYIGLQYPNHYIGLQHPNQYIIPQYPNQPQIPHYPVNHIRSHYRQTNYQEHDSRNFPPIIENVECEQSQYVEQNKTEQIEHLNMICSKDVLKKTKITSTIPIAPPLIWSQTSIGSNNEKNETTSTDAKCGMDMVIYELKSIFSKKKEKSNSNVTPLVEEPT